MRCVVKRFGLTAPGRGTIQPEDEEEKEEAEKEKSYSLYLDCDDDRVEISFFIGHQSVSR